MQNRVGNSILNTTRLRWGGHFPVLSIFTNMYK